MTSSMMIPEEEGEDTSSSGASLASDEVTVIGNEEDAEAEDMYMDETDVFSKARDRAFTASQVEVNILFWRNMAVAFCVGTGMALSVAANLSLSHWDDLDETLQEKLPAIFTGALAVNFFNITVIIYLFARHVMRLVTVMYTQEDHTEQEDTPVSRHSLMGLLPSVVPPKRNPKKKTTNLRDSVMTERTIPMDQGTDVAVAPTLLQDQPDHTKSTTSSNPVAALQASMGNLGNLLGHVRRQAGIDTVMSHAGTAVDTTTTMISGHHGKPIAELFPETTVLFADIEGFTAWSSTRQPTQVFVLLETLYHAFDSIALRRKVFKVETVGDCYMAVAGLPQPCKDHYIVMCKFGRDILKRMRPICKRLTRSLGPDTCELRIRVGIHSGPVTGGVLRGEKSRFQLFGDTVNTCARIESTGEGGRIHLSHATATLLQNAGKGHWVTKRPNKVIAKGLGSLQTYFLDGVNKNDNFTASDAQSAYSGCSSGDESDDLYVARHNPARGDLVPRPFSSSIGTPSSFNMMDASSRVFSTSITNAKFERLVAWNVEVLHRLLKQIVARRQCLVNVNPTRKADADESIYTRNRQGTLLDEVKESIELPTFNYSRVAAEQAQHIELDSDVYLQLQDYVRSVAELYPDHAFHNFEHASHVTMSVSKLLSRITDTSIEEEGRCMHDHTYGITSDPLTQFSCVLSALIHDADHPGVPNATLVKEQTPEAKMYKDRSVAESNSVDRCWRLLMEPKYGALRKTIYTTNNGLRRFRSLVVNSVMATDIGDKDLKVLRNGRWEKAFNTEGTADSPDESEKAAKDRKATIVIEHLIQASDVAHTMQHWHIYRKWNERLFQECYRAYKDGRAERHPAEYWYEGEKGFYDFYIIPLAKKLKECGVFGVSSSEYLDYAIRNREEWEQHGMEAVAEMVERVKIQESEVQAFEQ